MKARRLLIQACPRATSRYQHIGQQLLPYYLSQLWQWGLGKVHITRNCGAPITGK